MAENNHGDPSTMEKDDRRLPGVTVDSLAL